ncbi:cyclophilin-like fold protein [Succinispira mobilis]|uniref:cyclophilin-like fold protein n=1 Tax=Succinispira mobilis TaxID=78120 RepID=UPI000361EF66|nr:cyclophilin-like fold protein [Succinispira mobilis]
MKIKGLNRFLLLLLSVLLAFLLAACGFTKNSGVTAVNNSVAENSESPTSNSKPLTESNHSKQTGNVESEKMINAKITVGDKVFPVKLYNNETTRALIVKLPMTVSMTELNGREKYYHLSENLPVKSTETPATIHAGEIMCWSSNSLVLFYNTFSNSNGGYVRLGYIEDISGLKEVLGKGDVQVTFEISN